MFDDKDYLECLRKNLEQIDLREYDYECECGPIIPNECREGWITHKPKHTIKSPQPRHISINTRNRLHCKRKIKQSVRGLKLHRNND